MEMATDKVNSTSKFMTKVMREEGGSAKSREGVPGRFADGAVLASGLKGNRIAATLCS